MYIKTTKETSHDIIMIIQSECGKIRIRITPNTDTFYAVRLYTKRYAFSLVSNIKGTLMQI